MLPIAAAARPIVPSPPHTTATPDDDSGNRAYDAQQHRDRLGATPPTGTTIPISQELAAIPAMLNPITAPGTGARAISTSTRSPISIATTVPAVNAVRYVCATAVGLNPFETMTAVWMVAIACTPVHAHRDRRHTKSRVPCSRCSSEATPRVRRR